MIGSHEIGTTATALAASAEQLAGCGAEGSRIRQAGELLPTDARSITRAAATVEEHRAEVLQILADLSILAEHPHEL